jgi:hypothetical protein
MPADFFDRLASVRTSDGALELSFVMEPPVQSDADALTAMSAMHLGKIGRKDTATDASDADDVGKGEHVVSAARSASFYRNNDVVNVDLSSPNEDNSTESDDVNNDDSEYLANSDLGEGSPTKVSKDIMHVVNSKQKKFYIPNKRSHYFVL